MHNADPTPLFSGPPWRLAIFLLALGLAMPAGAAEKIRLQLKWTHAFQFAGYYAAREMGYYRDAGLEVEIREAKPGQDVVEDVVSGKAEFGVGTSSLLLDRKAGKPVVALAAIFQHSPLVIIAPDHDNAPALQDLAGKKLMIEPQADELIAYLKKEGLPLSRFNRVEHGYDVRDLLAGRVDAMTAYVTAEPWYLDKAGFRYHQYTPRAAGIDFYGDTLFTSEAQLRLAPERVRAFRAASLQGWKYAMAHPDKVAALIHDKYSAAHPLDYYQFEARKMVSLVQPDFVELGYMLPGRWRHIADTYADLGLLPRDFKLDGFLYDPNPQRDLGWLYRALALGAALLLVVSAVAIRFAILVRRLRASEERIRHMAQYDQLTELPNRALLFDRLQHALAAARRDGSTLAVMFFDLDGLKPVNDKFGHDAGDRFLREAARRMRAALRESDTVARIGGDEFLVLLPHIEARADAQLVADKVRAALAEPLALGSATVHISASIGIALFEHGTNGSQDEASLVRRADEAMYKAKAAGGDRIVFSETAAA